MAELERPKVVAVALGGQIGVVDETVIFCDRIGGMLAPVVVDPV